MSTIFIKILEWFLNSCKENKVKLPFKWKIILMIIIASLKAGKFLFFLSNILNQINIEVDKEKKTWKISSKYNIADASFQKRYYDDIDNIMRAHPELYKEWKISNTNIIIDTNPNATL